LGSDLFGDPNEMHPNLNAMRATGRVYPVMWGGPLCANFRARLYTGLASHRGWNLLGSEIAQSSWSLPTDRLLGRYVPIAFSGKWHVACFTDFDHPLRAGCTGAWSMSNIQNYWNWPRIVNGTATTCTTYST